MNFCRLHNWSCLRIQKDSLNAPETLEGEEIGAVIDADATLLQTIREEEPVLDTTPIAPPEIHQAGSPARSSTGKDIILY